MAFIEFIYIYIFYLLATRSIYEYSFTIQLINMLFCVSFRKQTSKEKLECQQFKQLDQSQIGYTGNHLLQDPHLCRHKII